MTSINPCKGPYNRFLEEYRKYVRPAVFAIISGLLCPIWGMCNGLPGFTYEDHFPSIFIFNFYQSMSNVIL
jgi:hypothetical protein